jgi:hypothetical protein
MLILTAAGEVGFSEGLGTSAIVEIVHVDVDGANKEPSLDMGIRVIGPFFKRSLMIA